MYDECGLNTDVGKSVNCAYNGTAKKLTDKKGLELLQKWCPYLYKGNIAFYIIAYFLKQP